MFDLIRLNAAYHLVPRGTTHTGLFICAMTRVQAVAMGWVV